MVYVWYKYSLIIGITWPLRHRGVAHVAWRAKIFTTVDIHAVLCHNEKDLNGELYQCEEGKDDNRLSVLYDLHRALGILVSAFYWGSEHQIPWFHSCVDKEWSVSERAFVSKCWQQMWCCCLPMINMPVWLQACSLMVQLPGGYRLPVNTEALRNLWNNRWEISPFGFGINRACEVST